MIRQNKIGQHLLLLFTAVMLLSSISSCNSPTLAEPAATSGGDEERSLVHVWRIE